MSNPPESRPVAQAREEAEPSEGGGPIPLIVVVVTLAIVLAGVAYILLTESFGPPGLGDRRTEADLRGTTASATSARAGQAVDGAQVYSANCVACHQASGKGLPGVFPPLDGSEWVNGDERILVNILLHGVTGKIEVSGQTYTGSMPPFGHLDSATLAAVLSHARGAWANKAAPVTAELVEKERKATPRTTPFSGGDELKGLAAKTP